MNQQAGDREAPLVLLVDGDENVLRLLSIKLPRAGFRVMTATDGEAGLKEALASEPAVVLVDGALPKLDGYRLSEALDGLPGHKRPAVVFLSAVDGPDAIEKALRSGGDDYVLKPFSPEELVHRLKVTLLRRRLATEKAEPAAGPLDDAISP
jgi:DNA-binding response OmpR family regulator